MPIDYDILKKELEEDPRKLGYASLIKEGNESGVTSLLNVTDSSILIPQGIVTKDIFVLGLARGLADLLGRVDEDPLKMAFRGWLELLKIVSNINVTNENVVTTLAAAINVGVFTQEEVDSVTKRPGSRAEELFGGIVSTSDISYVLRGDR